MENYANTENQAASKSGNRYVPHKGITWKCTKNNPPAAEMQLVDLPIHWEPSEVINLSWDIEVGEWKKNKREGKTKTKQENRKEEPKLKQSIRFDN